MGIQSLKIVLKYLWSVLLSCSTPVQIWNPSSAKLSAGWSRGKPSPAAARAPQHLPLQNLPQTSTAMLKLNILDIAQVTCITLTNTNLSLSSAAGSSIVNVRGPDLSDVFNSSKIFITMIFILSSFVYKFSDISLLNVLYCIVM